jgi:hypothetical protein
MTIKTASFTIQKRTVNVFETGHLPQYTVVRVRESEVMSTRSRMISILFQNKRVLYMFRKQRVEEYDIE